MTYSRKKKLRYLFVVSLVWCGLVIIAACLTAPIGSVDRDQSWMTGIEDSLSPSTSGSISLINSEEALPPCIKIFGETSR